MTIAVFPDVCLCASKGGLGFLISTPYLESQRCHLIPLLYLLSSVYLVFLLPSPLALYVL